MGAGLAGLARLALLFVRTPWAARILQVALAIATLEWLRTAWVFATARAAAGLPYARLLVIIGNRTLRGHFRTDHTGGD